MKQKQTKEEKAQEKKANTSLNQLISMAKKKGAFISEEIIDTKKVQKTLF